MSEHTPEMIATAMAVYADRYAEAWENPEDREYMTEDFKAALSAVYPAIRRQAFLEAAEALDVEAERIAGTNDAADLVRSLADQETQQ